MITYSIHSGIHVYTLNGDLEIYTADAIENALSTAPRGTLIIDVSAVEFIDSTGLAVLVNALKRVRDSGGNLCLCGVTPAVRTILHLTRLDRLFQIYANVETAVRKQKMAVAR